MIIYSAYDDAMTLLYVGVTAGGPLIRADEPWDPKRSYGSHEAMARLNQHRHAGAPWVRYVESIGLEDRGDRESAEHRELELQITLRPVWNRPSATAIHKWPDLTRQLREESDRRVHEYLAGRLGEDD